MLKCQRIIVYEYSTFTRINIYILHSLFENTKIGEGNLNKESYLLRTGLWM